MIRALSVILLLLCFAPLPATAMGAEETHVQSAFLFAKRRMWNEAIAHAQAAHSPILAKYFIWQSLKDPENNASFAEIVQFLQANPKWPDRAILEKRAEVALLSNNPSDAEIGQWFKNHPPQTSLAKLRSAKDDEALRSLVRDAWENDDYSKESEARLLEKYHDILRPEDHVRRINRLLWEGKEDDAKRLLKLAPYDHQRLFQARMALMEDKAQRAMVDIVNLPPALKNDTGLLFERIRSYAREGNKQMVRELLLQAPDDVPYPDKWWPFRDRQIRESVGEGNIPLAERLLAHHGQKEDSFGYREAEWLKGWLALEFNHKPEQAYNLFVTLSRAAQTPAGQSRADYWAGRAAEKLHNGDAKHWYENAAHNPTTFYGQLAAWELNNDAHLSIHSDAQPSKDAKKNFEKQELVRLVHALSNAHESDLAQKFILYMVETADSLDEAVLATRLGRDINRIDFSVRASKKALQNEIMSLESGYPIIRIPETTGPEHPLVLALTRQESEFYADAISSSGARGLMQLLPQTAKEIARKSHLPYSADLLFEPNYNMTVGSIYLGKMIDKFNGSYVLSIASYNAGPGRVGEWVDNFGSPGRDVHEAVDWIEKIPGTETRGYVQHVLENTEVYRFMLAGRKPVKLIIATDLTR